MNTKLDTLRFAPEHQTLQEIMQRFSLAPVLANFEANGGLRSWRDQILATQLRLTARLSPRLFGLLGEVRSTLGYEEPLDLFVMAAANVNACAIESVDGGPHMVSLTSGLVERMTDVELRFVLGHEIGHLHFDHYRARLVEDAIGTDAEGKSRMPVLLSRRLESWNRLAELSADRAGYAAIHGELEPIVSAFFKIASGLGPEHLHFDIAAFLDQLEELRQLDRRDSICGFSHPATPIRVRALQLFGEAGGAGAEAGRLAEVDRTVGELARLMEFEPTEPLVLQARDFLLAGGVLVGHADGQGFSEEESAALVEVLVKFFADPEGEMARITSEEQARELMRRSATWLREQAGEERFDLFRYLARIAAVDGVLAGQEEAVLLEAAELLGIPATVARNLLYEVLTLHLQTRQANRPKPQFLR